MFRPISAEETVRMYNESLDQLKDISKSKITEFTIVAGDQEKHAQGIAMTICSLIIKVSPEHKLPFLYLLDSIINNIGQEYRTCFKDHLPEVFLHTYKKIDPSLHPKMIRLLETWKSEDCFPHSELSEIEDELKVSLKENQHPASSGGLRNSGSQSPHLRGKHVDPKFLVAHHQSKHTAMDSQHVGLSSTSRSYKQHPSQGGEYDPEHFEFLPPISGLERIGATVVGRVEGMLPHQRPSSPPRSGPKIDTSGEMAFDISSLTNLGSGRRSDWNGGLAKTWPSGDVTETSVASNCYNGCDKWAARSLIAAYGSESASQEKPVKFPRLDSNGASSDVENGWERMSPGLPSQKQYYMSSVVGRSAGLTQSKDSYMFKDFGTDGQNQVYWPQSDDPSAVNAYPSQRYLSQSHNICRLDKSKGLQKSQPLLPPTGSIQEQFRSPFASETNEHMPIHINSEHSGFSSSIQCMQETNSLLVESRGRSALFTPTPVFPDFVAQPRNHVQGCVYTPILPNSLFRTTLPNPSVQGHIYSSHPQCPPPFSHSPLHPTSFPGCNRHHPSAPPLSTPLPPFFARQPPPPQELCDHIQPALKPNSELVVGRKDKDRE